VSSLRSFVSQPVSQLAKTFRFVSFRFMAEVCHVTTSFCLNKTPTLTHFTPHLENSPNKLLVFSSLIEHGVFLSSFFYFFCSYRTFTRLLFLSFMIFTIYSCFIFPPARCRRGGGMEMELEVERGESYQ